MDADSDFVFSVKRNVNVSFTKDPYPAMSDVDDHLTAVKRSSDERPVCFQECSQLWEEVRKANQVHRLGDCFVKVTMELFHRLRNDKLTSKEKVAILNFLCESGALQMDVSVSYGSEKSCVKPINTGVGGEKSSLSQKGREGEGHTRVDTEAETQGEVGKPSTYQTPEGTVTTADNRKMTQEGAVSTLGNMKTTQEGAMTTAGTRTTENEYTNSGHDIEKSLNTDSSKNCKDLPEGQFPSRSMHKNGTMTPQGGAIFAEHCHTIPHTENSMGISETNCFSQDFQNPGLTDFGDSVTPRERHGENNIPQVTQNSTTPTDTLLNNGPVSHGTRANNSDGNLGQMSTGPKIHSFWSVSGEVIRETANCKGENDPGFSSPCGVQMLSQIPNKTGSSYLPHQQDLGTSPLWSNQAFPESSSSTFDLPTAKLRHEPPRANCDSEKDTIFVCDICDGTVVGQENFLKHLQEHTGKGRLQQSVGPGKKSIQHRQVTHQLNQLRVNRTKPKDKYQKDFHCKLCGMAFSRRDSLSRHRFTHTGEKRHQCPVCGKRFSQKGNLKTHQHNVHAWTGIG